MMEELEIKEPLEYQHNKITIDSLLSILETDIYGRYDFYEMQRVILEDRRVRLNAWAAKILKIPVQKIKLNKHVNPSVSQKQLSDPKSIHYTTTRILPLTCLKQKEDITFTPFDFPVSIVDKPKYPKNEENLVRFKLLHRHSHKVMDVDNLHQTSNVASTVFLMKNINEGRNEKWNNYATLKGNSIRNKNHISL